MASPYQEFVAKARARRDANQKTAQFQKNTGEYVFTRHSEYKMQQYRLSAQRVRNVIRNPRRREEGIIPDTVGVMQPTSVKKRDGQEVWNQEIWCLYKLTKGQKKIISAWRYPGVSPKRDPIPEDILQELLDQSDETAVS